MGFRQTFSLTLTVTRRYVEGASGASGIGGDLEMFIQAAELIITT